MQERPSSRKDVDLIQPSEKVQERPSSRNDFDLIQPTEKVQKRPASRKDNDLAKPSVQPLKGDTESEDILVRQNKRLEGEIKRIKEGGGGRCSQILRMAKKFKDQRNLVQEPIL